MANVPMKTLQIETTSRCTLKCPACSRTWWNQTLKKRIPISDIDIEMLYKFLDCEKGREIKMLDLRGDWGDCIYYPKLFDFIDKFRKEKNFTICTNGAWQTEKFWNRLSAILVEGDVVEFSIDGLEDTNHLYRQDVEWNKVMDRIGWFIESGGKATWKWVPFKHNIHQTEQARKLSEELGFVEFLVEDHGRNHGPALDKNGNVTHWILPADGSLGPGKYDVPAGVARYKQTHENSTPEKKVYDIDCEHERYESIYIDAQGRIGPCCYQGFGLPDLPFIALDEFAKVKETWTTRECNAVCVNSCGLK